MISIDVLVTTKNKKGECVVSEVGDGDQKTAVLWSENALRGRGRSIRSVPPTPTNLDFFRHVFSLDAGGIPVRLVGPRPPRV